MRCETVTVTVTEAPY